MDNVLLISISWEALYQTHTCRGWGGGGWNRELVVCLLFPHLLQVSDLGCCWSILDQSDPIHDVTEEEKKPVLKKVRSRIGERKNNNNRNERGRDTNNNLFFLSTILAQCPWMCCRERNSQLENKSSKATLLRNLEFWQLSCFIVVKRGEELVLVFHIDNCQRDLKSWIVFRKTLTTT